MPAQSRKCPQCGKEFTCSGEANCWCSAVYLTDIQRTDLAEKYSNCLCESCLKEFSEKSTEGLDKSQ